MDHMTACFALHDHTIVFCCLHGLSKEGKDNKCKMNPSICYTYKMATIISSFIIFSLLSGPFFIPYSYATLGETLSNFVTAPTQATCRLHACPAYSACNIDKVGERAWGHG